MKLSISYLSVHDDKEKELKKLSMTTTNYIHVDIMDGVFVPNKTENFKIQKEWLDKIEKPLDVHLMVEDIEKYIELYQNLKPEYITFHVELNDRFSFSKIIHHLHQAGIKVGLSIKPNTLVEEVKPYLKDIDLVLVMSVEPGMGGQSFIPSSLEKIRTLKQYQKDYSFLIEVDGGINKETSYQCAVAGADIIVVGSYITNSNDYQKQINTLYL